MRIAIVSDDRTHLTELIVEDVKRGGPMLNFSGRLQIGKSIGLPWRSRLLVGSRTVVWTRE